MKTAAIETSAVILIDHQTGTMDWVGSVPQDRLKAHTRALAMAAVALNMPLVLTSSMEDHAQGPLMPELAEIAPQAYAARIKRPGVVNCWDDPEFARACRNTGRKQFIMAGVTTEVCLAPPAISAREEDFDVFAIVDASGSPTTLTDEMAFRRMERAGVELTTTSAILSELAKDWSSPGGSIIMQILASEVL